MISNVVNNLPTIKWNGALTFKWKYTLKSQYENLPLKRNCRSLIQTKPALKTSIKQKPPKFKNLRSQNRVLLKHESLPRTMDATELKHLTLNNQHSGPFSAFFSLFSRLMPTHLFYTHLCFCSTARGQRIILHTLPHCALYWPYMAQFSPF